MPQFVRRPSTALAIFALIAAAPAMCRAAFVPPVTHITPQDVQVVVQCYVGASRPAGLSACAKQAGNALQKKNRGQGIALDNAGAAGQSPVIGPGLVSPAYLSGAATLLGLLWLSAVLLRAGRGRHKPGRPYYVAGNTSCS